MATYFSEHYQPTEQGAVTAETAGFKSPIGVAHARKRSKKASFIITPATNDVLRLFRVRSSDRITRFSIANFDVGGANSSTWDFGFRQSDGTTVVDADAIANGVDLTTQRDVLTDFIGFGAGSLYKMTAAKAGIARTVWEALGLTADPGLVYECVGLCTAAGASPTVGGIVVEMEYLAGD